VAEDEPALKRDEVVRLGGGRRVIRNGMRWGIAACHPHGDECLEGAVLSDEDGIATDALDEADDASGRVSQGHGSLSRRL